MAETAERDAEKPGDIIELEPTNPAHGGEFVARSAGRVVFVADAVDGERVLARLTDTAHAGFWRARVVRVLEPSPWRQRHVWTEAGVENDPSMRPGGAEYGHIALSHQRALKERVLEEALQRFAGLDRRIEVSSAPGDEEAGGTGWRTRVRLHAGSDGFGPYAARSHRVVPVTSLPLATAPVATAAPLSRRQDRHDALAGADTVDVVQAAASAVLLYRTPPASRRAPRTARWHTLPTGGTTLTHTVAGMPFEVAAGGFWQVHREAPDVLFQAVADAVGDPDPAARHLDLYGGVGVFAAALATKAGSAMDVTSVESDHLATRNAHHNLAAWPHARAVTAQADRYLAGLADTASAVDRARYSAGTVVLDPPRSGAGKSVVAHLARLRPARIVYVACDPVALARDLGLFQAAGYEVGRIRAFDLFPHTHHVEAIAVLHRHP